MKKLLLILNFVLFSFGANTIWKLTEQKDEVDGSKLFYISTD